MAAPEITYDLTVLLDSELPEEQRERILADVEAMIAETGTIVSAHDWGRRKMAYEIRHKTDADYHLIQLHGPRELLERLDRTLRITDGVVRYRIIKLRAGTPAPPDLRATAAAAAVAPAAEAGDVPDEPEDAA
jgi:small subunit ribosomal protein S6